MNYLSFFMAYKYLRSKKNSRFTAIISKSSIIGIALGIAAIVVVMSIMNGFHSEMRDKILSMVSHVIITEKNYTLENWQQLKKEIDQNELVIGSAPYVEGQAMFSHNGNVHGVQLKGIIPEYEKNVTSLSDNIVDGNMDLIGKEPYQISIGTDLAKKMNLKIGDKITLVIPRTNTTMIGIIPRLKRFEVSSIFEFGMAQYDKNLVFINSNHSDGYKKLGLYDVIVNIDLSFHMNNELIDQLVNKGKIFFCEQHNNEIRESKLSVIHKSENGFSKQSLFDINIPFVSNIHNVNDFNFI